MLSLLLYEGVGGMVFWCTFTTIKVGHYMNKYANPWVPMDTHCWWFILQQFSKIDVIYCSQSKYFLSTYENKCPFIGIVELLSLSLLLLG